MARALSFLDGVRSLRGVRADFVPRIGGVPVMVDKWESLRMLEPAHRERVAGQGFLWEDLWRAEQVHGDGIAVVPRASGGAGRLLPKVDGLLTSGEQRALLGIYVADCAAVYLADRETGALGLIHSGKKGTEQEIVLRGIEMMRAEFGTQVDDLEAAISPCIRPPHYEVDISVHIEGQLLGAGIPREQVRMSGVCTGAEVANYYSYRLERGRTGRMLALLGRKGDHPGS